MLDQYYNVKGVRNSIGLNNTVFSSKTGKIHTIFIRVHQIEYEFLFLR